MCFSCLERVSDRVSEGEGESYLELEMDGKSGQERDSLVWGLNFIHTHR